MVSPDQKNEGEGNRTAAQEYNQRAEEFAHNADVDKLAQEAARALDSEEGEALRQAEKKGREKLDSDAVKVEREV